MDKRSLIAVAAVALAAHGLASADAAAQSTTPSGGAPPSRAVILPIDSPTTAPATNPTPVDPREQEARSAFEAGVAALTDERYADALVHFQRSYDVRRAASAALNLGVTLRALGRLVEARQRFNEFLELASAAQHERHDREVAAFIADISRRIGRVRVAVVDPPSARLLIDGRRAALDERDEVALDPGEHRVEAVLAGYDTAMQSVTVSAGGRAEVQLRLRRSVIDARVVTPPSQPQPQSGGILRSPAFWVIVGVAVTAAVAIPVTIAVSSGPEIPTLSGVFCVRTDGVPCSTTGGAR